MFTKQILSTLIAITGTAAVAADGLYVAVGYGGRRMSSKDGVTWENVQQWSDKSADDANNLMGLAFGKGKWVCVGGGGFAKDSQAGHILVSTDGKEWREVAKYPFRVNPVLFQGERFVAGGPSKQLLWSTDGEKWSEGETVKLPPEVPGWAFWFRGGAAGNGVYLFVGNAGTDQKIWWGLTSRTGSKIDSFSTELPPVKGLAFGAGKFVIASKDGIYTSPDGKNFKREAGAPQEEFKGVVWTGKEFLAFASESYESSDGVKWRAVGKAPSAHVLWADKRGFIATSWPGKMSFSRDGKTWKSAEQPTPMLGINKVVHGVPGGSR